MKDDLNEDENEALSYLLKLDKGLRSGVISQQCESVIHFSDLIRQHPIPSIISSSLLKLSELFQNW